MSDEPYAGWLGDSAAERKLGAGAEKITRHLTATGSLVFVQALFDAVEGGLRDPDALVEAAQQGMIEDVARRCIDPASLYETPRLMPFDPQSPDSMRAFCDEIAWWLDVAEQSIVSVSPAARRRVEDGVKSSRELVAEARAKLERGQDSALDLYKAYDRFQRCVEDFERAEARREVLSENASGPRRRCGWRIKEWLEIRAMRAPEASLGDLVRLPGKKPEQPNWGSFFIWRNGTEIILEYEKDRHEKVSIRTMERYLKEIRESRSSS